MPHGIVLYGVFITTRVDIEFILLEYTIYILCLEKKKTFYVTIHNKNSKLFHFSKKRIENSEVEYSRMNLVTRFTFPYYIYFNTQQ